jgi:hypothetical protein
VARCDLARWLIWCRLASRYVRVPLARGFNVSWMAGGFGRDWLAGRFGEDWLASTLQLLVAVGVSGTHPFLSLACPPLYDHFHFREYGPLVEDKGMPNGK